ncbi:hypothetical protein G6Z92_04815 [Vibrio aestuarianus subsp. cardii]|uniref:hypothetical protein n=1 Tax=Vibrio aestuarianus TaxID=28171 RepID=UPI0015C54AD3|nr:hypothetical protein [Vibrio aestuarianus]NGZ66309.1 hypothetical protein [Vibrio aestuarianus subsp. cardii]
MFDDFLGDFQLKDAVGAWLANEQIKRVDDATGKSQDEVYNTPGKIQQVNDTVTATNQTGLSMPVMIGAGVGALVLFALLIRK